MVKFLPPRFMRLRSGVRTGINTLILETSLVPSLQIHNVNMSLFISSRSSRQPIISTGTAPVGYTFPVRTLFRQDLLPSCVLRALPPDNSQPKERSGRFS